ncbi:MAG: energy transducer TonB [Candidatus Nucleicultricaceae bacterium]
MKNITKHIQSYIAASTLSFCLHGVLFGLTLYGFNALTIPPVPHPIKDPSIELLVVPSQKDSDQASTRAIPSLLCLKQNKTRIKHNTKALNPVSARTLAKTPLIENKMRETPATVMPSRENKVSETIIEKPRYELGSKFNPAPPYPNDARERAEEGTVIVLVRVGKDGLVKKLKILQSSGYASLDSSTLLTLQTWIFTPAQIGDQKVESELNVDIQFALDSTD